MGTSYYYNVKYLLLKCIFLLYTSILVTTSFCPFTTSLKIIPMYLIESIADGLCLPEFIFSGFCLKRKDLFN